MLVLMVKERAKAKARLPMERGKFRLILYWGGKALRTSWPSSPARLSILYRKAQKLQIPQLQPCRLCVSCPHILNYVFRMTKSTSETARKNDDDCSVLPGWVYVHRDCSTPMDGSAEQRYGNCLPWLQANKSCHSRSQIPRCNDRYCQRGQYHRGNGRDWQGNGRSKGS